MTHPYSKIARTVSHNSRAAGGQVADVASRRKGSLLGALVAFIGAGILYKIFFSNRSRPKRLPSIPTLHAHNNDVQLRSSISINRSVGDIYDFWRDFSNLPRVMSFLDRVEPKEGEISHWVAKVPAGPSLEWDSKVVEDKPPYQLSWCSLEGSEIETRGTVVFEPKGDGTVTEVTVSLSFSPPGGVAGAAVASFLKSVENSVLAKSLQDLKTHMEANNSLASNHFSNKLFGAKGPARAPDTNTGQ